LGVVKEVGDVEDFTAKSQKSYSKREIVVVDNSEAQVRCTVWGNAAKSWEIGVDNIVILKSVKVSDFGGRSLSMTFGSSVTPNPDIDQAFTLKGWYDAQGQRDLKSFQSHVGLAPSMGGAIGRTDPVKTLAQVRDDVRPIDNEVSYFTTVATIVYIKHDNVSYPACTEDGCNKKVINYDDSWRCEKCNKSIAKPQYR
jgi:replication factor A1